MYKFLFAVFILIMLMGCSNNAQESSKALDQPKTNADVTEQGEITGPKDYTVKFAEPFIFESVVGPKLEITVDYLMYSNNMASAPFDQDFVPTDELWDEREEYDSKYKYAEIYLRVKNVDEKISSYSSLHDEYSFNFYDEAGDLIDDESIDQLPYETYYTKNLDPGEENEGIIFIALPKEANPTKFSYHPIPTGDEYYFDMGSLNLAN